MPVVDTTAAGDAFTAALTLEYLRSGDMMGACDFANAAGSITVSRHGASSSIPNEAEVTEFLNTRRNV
jgi:ribokinase